MKLFIITLLSLLAFSLALPKHIWLNPLDALRKSNTTETVFPLLNTKLRTINEMNLMGGIRRKFAAAAALIKPGKDMICSPVSALMPLGKLSLGAQGRSLEELKNAVGFTLNDRASKQQLKELEENLRWLKGIELKIASMVYVSDRIPLNEHYVSEVTSTFETSVTQLDFSVPAGAAASINAWVSSETNDKIKDLIDPQQIDASTTIILVNAIYFKGSWLKPFTSTSAETFFGRGGVETSVKMMHATDQFSYSISEELQAKIIEIPYKGGAASLVVVLPLERDGLSIVLHKIKLAPELLDESLKGLTPRTVALHLPRFKITTTLNLVPLYKNAGVSKIFDEEDSGLTGIPKDRNKKLSVGEAVQKALIEVNEEGSEGSVSSILSLNELPHPITAASFHANHPFYFFVIAKTEQIFSGTFYNDHGEGKYKMY